MARFLMLGKYSLIVFIIVSFLVSTRACADTDPFRDLLSAKSIKCSWGQGIGAYWEKGVLNIKKTIWEVDKKKSFSLIYAINIKKKTAKLKGEQGAADVNVMVTPEGITFIEETPAGKVNIITVFTKRVENSDKFYAVISRHMYFFEDLSPRQYYGTAEIVDR